jgi:hypothetical protein
MRFEVESDFLKPASSIVTLSLLALLERDERGGRGDPSGRQGEAGCGGDCESGEQKGLYVRIACARAAAGAGEEELLERVQERPRTW